jgi:hypothetical protein
VSDVEITKPDLEDVFLEVMAQQTQNPATDLVETSG